MRLLTQFLRGFALTEIIPLLILLFCVVAPVRAQFADVSGAGGPVVINALWRYHVGDDPQWALPGFDDSHWSLMRTNKSWADQGYKGYHGYSWHRIRLKLPAGKAPLAIAFYEIGNADEIYADGQWIGSIGQMRPVPAWRGFSNAPLSFRFPLALNGKTIELAVRVWNSRESADNIQNGRNFGDIQVGAVPAIASLCEASADRSLLAEGPEFFLALVAVGIGLFSLGLFVLRHHSTEYVWAAIYLLCSAGLDVGPWFYHRLFWPNYPFQLGLSCVVAAWQVAWLFFIWGFVRIPRDRSFHSAIALSLLSPVLGAMVFQHWIVITYLDVEWALTSVAIGVLVLERLARLAWKGNREAQLLLVPFLLGNAIVAFEQSWSALYYFGWIHSLHATVISRGPIFTLYLEEVFNLLSYVAVGAVLALRFTRSAERDERLSAEMAAAHAVQAQLVPARLPATPHFGFATAYFAAGEVGGDFYQVFPKADGSVLIVVGDVSGKGLKAAMLGTLVVGALRALAQDELPPAQILARLNMQLTGSSDGGLVTCVVLHIAPDGHAVIANAGHLAPYRNGEELQLDSSLPLGIVAEAEYGQSSFALEPGDQLTFLSDGVVEAQNADGELFGFERTRSISRQSAQQIADAARRFGQEDDITVVTLSFAPAAVAIA